MTELSDYKRLVEGPDKAAAERRCMARIAAARRVAFRAGFQVGGLIGLAIGAGATILAKGFF